MTATCPRIPTTLLAAALCACAPDERGSGGFVSGGSASPTEPSSGGGEASGASSSGKTSDGDATSSSGTGGGDVLFDVAVGGATDNGSAEGGSCDPRMDPECSGCTAVDILFIIDNSVSMGPYQMALAQAFPQFADALVEALPSGTDVHVGVTSTEMAYVGDALTSGCMGSSLDQPAADFYITPDQTNTMKNGAQGRLYVADGKPYYAFETDAPQSELDSLRDWFMAAANIGTGGSNIEMATAAAAWATDSANDATNAGFLRDEGAVLVLFFLQDEPDQSPNDVAQELVDMVAGAKAGCGGMSCVIGGGFVNEGCLSEVPLGVMLDALGKPAITENLPLGGGGQVGSAEMVALLENTLAGVIAETCEEIPPPVG